MSDNPHLSKLTVKRVNSLIRFIPCLLLFLPITAMAYLDPGTGSMMLQVVLGGIAAIGVALKLFWYRIIAFFGFRKKPAEEDKTG